MSKITSPFPCDSSSQGVFFSPVFIMLASAGISRFEFNFNEKKCLSILFDKKILLALLKTEDSVGEIKKWRMLIQEGSVPTFTTRRLSAKWKSSRFQVKSIATE